MIKIIVLLVKICLFQKIFADNQNLIFLTLVDGQLNGTSQLSHDINVNLVVQKSVNGLSKDLLLNYPQGGSKKHRKQGKKKLASEYDMGSIDPAVSIGAQSVEKTLFSATMPVKNGAAINYKINSDFPKQVRGITLPAGNETNLKVCVFGDYSANLYPNLHLSNLIDQNKCQINLFTGKIAWEQQGNKFSFNPFVMFDGGSADDRHASLAKVPSILGELGHDLNETTFFQAVEVNNVVFIQTTVELGSLANFVQNSQQRDMIEKYFRETMLNELECKLQELHSRPKRPWIIVYLTHPYLFTEENVNWLMLNDVDRFFEILNRYHIDLLTSCGIEGMSRMLEKKKLESPGMNFPSYIQTTMAECVGQAFDPTVQNECSHVILTLKGDSMSYEKKNANDGTQLGKGDIQKDYSKPDECIS